MPAIPKTWGLGKASAIVAPVLMLGACALSPAADDSATKQAAQLVRIATPNPEPAPFVRESRPPATTFIPVGVTPPKRELQPRGASGAAALEAELDAERKRSEEFARRPAPAQTYDGTIPPRVQPPPKELTPQ